ncbi:MAG: T9SS type A sorting domain-containing protein, partial [Flavobacterium sp.]
VNLSAYAGQSIRVVFRHHESSNQSIVFLDDVVVEEGVMGTKDAATAQFSVFPNPATNLINVASANAVVNAVSIIDLNGRTVKTANFDGVSEAQVNISDLSSGVYMMSVASDKGTTTKKIVKN